MAPRWRIRHKLMLGLGLVVAIIGLLLGGTLYGLAKFHATLTGIDLKKAELVAAEDVKAKNNELHSFIRNNSGTANVQAVLLEKFQFAREALDKYDSHLKETILQSRDPLQGGQEGGDVESLRRSLQALSKIVIDPPNQSAAYPLTPSAQVKNNPDLESQLNNLERTSSDLIDEIYGNLTEKSKKSKEDLNDCLWIVITTSAVGVILLVSLLRFFYTWVFYPIRDLEQGAVRVAQGNFSQRIDVHSGDELEDLADAFNVMTSRLSDMYGDLARQVNDRSRQLVRSERLAGVGFLAAGVAHEINNPLASIAFCSEALETRLAGVLARFPDGSDVITKYLKMIQTEAFRCKEITQRLLEFSRGGERRRQPTDLVKLIQDVLEMVQHLQNCKGKHIDFNPRDKLIAWVNAQEIRSVILNLVVNSLDSMDEGGRLRIRLGQRDFMAELVFADTGCGMSPEILENIFEPFFTKSRTGKGTGLGLSISHRVVSQHGGEIEAISPGPNQGSTFTVRLPLEPMDPSKEESFGHAAA